MKSQIIIVFLLKKYLEFGVPRVPRVMSDVKWRLFTLDELLSLT